MAGRVGAGIRPMALGLVRVLCLGAARAVVAAHRPEVWCTCRRGQRRGRDGVAVGRRRRARGARGPGALPGGVGMWLRMCMRRRGACARLRWVCLCSLSSPCPGWPRPSSPTSCPHRIPFLPRCHACPSALCACVVPAAAPILPRARARRDAGARMLALCMLLFCVCALRAWLYGPALRTLASTCCAFGVPVQFCPRPATVGAPRKALADIVDLPT